MINSWIDGLTAGLALIMVIGAQSAFVLKQALMADRGFLAATVSFCCDVFLLTIGIAGFGALIAQSLILKKYASIAGAVFLFGYAARSIYLIFYPKTQDISGGQPKTSSWLVVALAALGFSLINPHAWLDMVVLMGGISNQYVQDQRLWFYLGAVAASALWLYGLVFGAKFLEPLFRYPATWRILNGIIAALLINIAFGLIEPYMLGV